MRPIQYSILNSAQGQTQTANQIQSIWVSNQVSRPKISTHVHLSNALAWRSPPPPLSSLPLALAIGTHGSWNSRLCTAVLYSMIRMFMHQLIHIPFHISSVHQPSPAQPSPSCDVPTGLGGTHFNYSQEGVKTLPWVRRDIRNILIYASLYLLSSWGKFMGCTGD